MKNNLTFIGGKPTWGNACVGNNGQPNYLHYAKGYSKSANILIETVLKSRRDNDTLIYPICFNMRHSVELRLKGLIDDLKEFKEYNRTLPLFALDTTHDLGNIWEFIKIEVPRLDKRFNRFLEKLDSYITDIADVDATGQVFRYPMSNENQKHLVKINIISIPILYERFKELEHILDELNYFKEDIIEEYRCESYTKKLSRVNIYNIAKLLPKRQKWSEKSFKLCKEEIKNEFKISERELSKAINIIQNHYEFSQLISVSKKLEYTTLDDLILFFDVWFLVHQKEFEINSLCSSDTDSLIKVIKQGERITYIFNEFWNKKLKYMKKESFIEIRALLYFNELHCKYSEQYKIALTQNLQEGLLSQYKVEFERILGKYDAFENILSSLKFLGQEEVYDVLIQKYDKQVKNKVFWQKNPFLEYT